MNYFEEYENKNILITGGAGCIGSNLTKKLSNLQASKIIILDDLSASERWNIPDEPNVVFIEGSILDEKRVKRVFSEKIDYVFHLAAHFANQNSVDHPETDLLVNGLGTLKLLQYSQMTKIPKFIFASSGCSVYGSQNPLPLKEDYVSINLDTPYQITKLLGELYCNFFYNYYRLPIVILRFFNVYGPGEIPGKYRNVIPNFIYRAMHKKKLPITGTGEETRDFTFVKDAVDGILRGGVISEAVGEAFNIASQTETKVIDLANIINELLENPNGIEFIEKRKWDKITKRCASIEKARKILGYNPKTQIKEGIKKTIDWFLSNNEKIEESAIF
ncbi:MAG: NAD-dependent epimerase/dehydratase family protein [Candidatus Humimicrobiia bacterium]